ncbi:MAG: hypothetical protein LBK25_08850 [Treponema sp.]|nr:hypothetical protein [Treponema sp.]
MNNEAFFQITWGASDFLSLKMPKTAYNTIEMPWKGFRKLPNNFGVVPNNFGVMRSNFGVIWRTGI